MSIMNSELWSRFPLQMTQEGVARFKVEVSKANQTPVVYSHVERNSRRVIRIGLTKPGLKARWVSGRGNHLATFEWAMKWSDRYRTSAEQFPQYVLFFLQLAGRDTDIWTMRCSETELKATEGVLITEFGPVWEQFNENWKLLPEEMRSTMRTAVCRQDFRECSVPRFESFNSKRPWPELFYEPSK